MNTILTLLFIAISMQSVSAWARYYDGESAAFVFVDQRRIADLTDGSAILDIAIRPPATWMGVKGYRQIHVSGFPIHLLNKIREIGEPAFFVFYSDRATLTEKKADAPDAVKIGGAVSYSVGILTATKLFSLTGDAINLQDDVDDWIKAYRNLIDQEDLKERDFYLKLWASDWQPMVEDKAAIATPSKPTD